MTYICIYMTCYCDDLYMYVLIKKYIMQPTTCNPLRKIDFGLLSIWKECDRIHCFPFDFKLN